jgi:protein TonB
MTAIRPSPRERVGAATATVLLVAAVGYAFIAGLTVRIPVVTTEAMQLFNILPKPPPKPKPIKLRPVISAKRAGAAAPPNLRSKPTDIVAPKPPVQIIPPPPIVVAPKTGAGRDASAGAAAIRGPGSGSGGIGNGTGSGGEGNGDGDGGFTAPRLIKGRLKNSDYRRPPGDPGTPRTVGVIFVVAPNGRVTDCDVTRSSGDGDLDNTTCRLIEQRFRFDPSRDPSGRPVESEVEETHSWDLPTG